MKGDKILNLKTTLFQLVDMLNAEDRLSLIIFNAYPQLLCNLRKVDEDNKPEIKELIDSIRPSGGTNICKGMEMAFDILKKR